MKNRTWQVKDPVRSQTELINQILDFKYRIDNNNIDNNNNFFEERRVEDKYLDVKNIICTTFFTSKRDPQRGIFTDSDNINYIKPWYYSMKKNNYHGIVFYDSLSEEFIKTYETDNIKFVKCTLGRYSLNDERFIIYYMYFIKKKYENILFTDGNDITINKDPFILISNKNRYTIFLGRGQDNKIYQSQWNIDGMDRLANHLNYKVPNNYYDMAVYNAGIIGGNYYTTMTFIEKMCFIFMKADNSLNNNMAVMHYVAFNYFLPNCNIGLRKKMYSLISLKIKKRIMRELLRFRLVFFVQNIPNYKNDRIAVGSNIFSGFPLNSRFKKFEKITDAYIIHK
jgi:hypothetical protein